ncbi:MULTISPECIES: DUF2798 domain-containing protein [Cocleimonas]|uniref:Uncharacterized protein DUF2798 n=1 Tax=Cocleimonas flava TaxID=634765 RepID=A0A4R1F0M8_9GAMM|nr:MULTISPECIES: DUF2798 domain-containing protein [Cocleimonas]MEB8433031.1 DUF2798 domain-containing protein [Cocleimonas sp. KMM 6892]MEC4715988.1 DUF2798 domain-containing protein [Cocleimonas sp. KMM 6895]MEC4745449.1 DUF2798 domain-containing protein [Cocleimonas sp. KMM 6896]TCJ87776.1 uncharacterized protein DUF2798 [Cocleimonas flava]
MIHKKYTAVVFSFFMALLMSCFMSFVITLFNVGLIDGILIKWLKAWSFAFLVAFPTVLIVGPIVRRLVALLIDDS